MPCERLSRLLIHGQTMEDLGVLWLYMDFVTCFCEVSLEDHQTH